MYNGGAAWEDELVAKKPIIKKTGTLSGVGTPGEASSDLVPGETINLSDEEAENAGATYQWFLDDQPIDAGVTLVNPTSPTPSFVVPSDAATKGGTFAVRCVINGVFVETLHLGLPLPNTGTRIPAFQERTQWNESGNTKGWHQAQTHFIREADKRLPYLLDVDPSVAGVEAPIGSLGLRDNGGTGELWIKQGASDTNWGQPSGGGGGSSDHGALTGLGDDDHTQYLLIDGSRAMTGALDMGAQAITNVGNVDVDGSITQAGNTVADLATHQTFTAAQGSSAVALFDGTNIATDASAGNVFTVTLGGNRTLDNPTNLVAGFTYIWIITQDGTGGRTLSYGSVFAFPGGSAPTLSTGANAVDILSGVYDGTQLNCQITKAFS